MVNLLFISNSPKMDIIKRNLQPLLKVKIDIVSDFDYGLKDVFEKRPATVFIQEQIAGVTGESVARHIQMLLGSGAPSFIFMHEDSSKVKPIKGLFEHMVDLSQSETKLVADIQGVLRSLLGPQWEKIYISPKVTSSDVMSAGNVPSENRAIADQLVDDLLSDLESSDTPATGQMKPTHDFSVPEPPQDEPMIIVSSKQDQLAEILAETARKPAEPPAAVMPQKKEVPRKSSSTAVDSAVTKKQQSGQPLQPSSTSPQPNEKIPVVAVVETKPPDRTPIDERAPKTTAKSSPESVGVVSVPTAKNDPQQIPPVSPADFRISDDRPVIESRPEELLLAFEDNYRLQVRTRKRNVAIAAVVLVCLVGGWYIFKLKPHLYSTLFNRPQSAQVPGKSVNSVPSVPAVQKPVSAARKVVAAPLPSFIPQAGFDSTFSTRNPGWERYSGSAMEFRIFRSDNRIKAVQVLALPEHDISSSVLKTVLAELTGSSDFSVTSTENKAGYQVSRARVNKSKADLLIYRSKSLVRAFVVSID